jgi:hypothetical protein
MQLLQTLRTYTRRRRKIRFESFISQLPRRAKSLRIIDIGGTVSFWRDWWGLTADDGLEVTLINDHTQDDTDDEVSTVSFITSRRADALTLTQEDFREFDCVFSNSCIEHLSSRNEQSLMAQAITNSGLPHFVQVPNKFAPIDPHFPRPYAPMFAAYPRRLQQRLLTLPTIDPAGRHSFESAGTLLRNYHPLGPSDVRALFPAAQIVIERPLGVPMSILAMWRPA